MSKELPYVDEKGQLHYEAYFGKGRAFLRSALPTSHPEHLYNYLQRHGIDWKLFFEEDGRRKGIDHEHGPDPYEKIFGIGNSSGSERVEYTRSDMERAFTAGAANAAKERIWKKDGLIPPILDFNQWLDKYEEEKKNELFKRQAEGRRHRKGQSTPVIYEIINSGDLDKTVIDLLNKKQSKKHFLHEIIAEVVMLPTSRASHLYAIENGGKTTLYFEEYPSKNVNAGNQHLYFLSNEKPKKGDWAYDPLNPSFVFYIDDQEDNLDFCKKIIATTDHSLRMKMPTRDGFPYEFPSPKDEFLFLYIGAHNTGRPVKEVSIEAELLCCQTGAPCGMPCNGDCEKNAVKSMVVDITNTINVAVK